MPSDPDTTLLVLSAIGVPPYSARGLTQTLEPVPEATSLRRTVNGSLIDLSAPELFKYRSVISCDDQQSPAFDGLKPGTQLTVDCVSELAYETVTGPGAGDRTAVSGSEREEDGFTFYRPQLTMRVAAWRIRTDEYGAAVGWDLELLEV